MPTPVDTTRLARALLAPEDRDVLDRGSGPGGLLGPEPQRPELKGLLGQEGMLGNPFGPPTPLGPRRLWPPESPDDEFWQRFHNDQLYRGVPREQIPPRMREQIPIEVPDVDPVFPDDRWGRLITRR